MVITAAVINSRMVLSHNLVSEGLPGSARGLPVPVLLQAALVLAISKAAHLADLDSLDLCDKEHITSSVKYSHNFT